MKTSFRLPVALSLCLSAGLLRGQSTLNNGTAPALSSPTPYSIVQKDANSQLWERTVYELDPSGRAVPKKHRYMELSTGLNFWDSTTSQWKGSKEEIDILPNGTAAATQGQHQAYFPGDIAQGVIELVTPDGLKLQSRPIGLGYDNGSNTVLIGVLAHSAGELLGSNQVIYPNAFDGVAASVRYRYTKSGFEQDIVLEAQPPTPESFGFNPQTTRLQVLTEFFDPPQPIVTPTTVATAAGDLTDDNLDFGVMQMVPGKSFLLSTSSSPVAVNKQWVLAGGRQFLIEEVPVMSIADELLQLPLPQTTSIKPNPPLNVVSAKRLLPAQRLATVPGRHPVRVAQAAPSSRGLVLDYVMMTSQTNYTFQGDTTYYISGTVNLKGANFIEAGTVIKYTNNASINVAYPATVQTLTAAYRPAIFTAMDDNTVGETISGSTGNPISGAYANPALYLGKSQTLSNLRIAYAQQALTIGNTVTFYNIQIVNCNNGASVSGTTANFYNALFANMVNCFNNLNYGTVTVENGTFCNIHNYLITSGSCCLSFTAINSILVWVNNLIYAPQAWGGLYTSVTGNNNYLYGNGFSAFGTSQVSGYGYPFQTVGAGSFYLANGCNLFSQGTTNIDPTLLSSLAQKTTYPPTLLTNTTISVATNLSPQVQRDTNAAPTLGYHYDPIDYAVSGVSLSNAIVAVCPGMVIAAFGTSDNAFGLNLGMGTEFLCKGLATNWNRIVAYNMVQEQSGTAWQAPTNGLVTDVSGDASSSLDCRFTDWSVPAQDEAFLAITNYNSETSVALRDCQFHGGSLFLDYLSAGDPAINNCLFERVNLTLNATLGTVFSVQNNLFWHGAFNFAPTADDSVVQNNLFDQTVIPDNSSTYGTYIGGYNAYVTNCDQLQPQSTSDLVLTNPPVYRVGPLGSYYQSTNSLLINAGSTNADQLGLYDYTVLTNLVSGHEIKETNSIVDIGYHYVAVDSNGVPLTTYTNGLPDYLVTSSTDPIPDWWEFTFFGNLDQATNGDYDNDGTNNLTEYQNGTDPNKISFSFSFQNQYVNTNIVTAVITILGGMPSSVATLVDSANFSSATWTNYTSSVTVNLGSMQGPHDIWIGLRGRLTNSYPTWEETTLSLDSTLPSITITNPASGVSLSASRVNVSGTFTAASLRQITVNDSVAFVNGTNFEALNVPLAGGTNRITVVVEDLTGVTNAFSINVVGVTNSDGSMNSPVQLQATPVAGFAPLPVTFSVQANVPGTIQQVFYDFNGDDTADLITNNLLPLSYTYATNGEYFPVVTIQTTAGRFSSVGGWNAVAPDPSNQPVQINVQAALTQTVFTNIADPVDLKWDGANLYVLSGSTATITEFDTNADVIRSLNGIGSDPSGLDVDSSGNVYVAVTANNQVWKFNPTDTSFAADTSFGNGGFIGTADGSSGNTNGAFNAPFDVAVSPDGGTISVSDSGNNRIQQFSAADGSFIATFGTNGSAVGLFSTPKGLTYDANGILYIMDSGNSRIVEAQFSGVIGVAGTSGTDLGQFDAPIGVSVGKRGVYVADTGNDRIEQFSLLPAATLFSITPFNIGYAISSGLNQPAAVVAVDDPMIEEFYVADTDHNRVVLYSVALDDPTPAWTNMTARVANGDISGAMQQFYSVSTDRYRQAFVAMGTNNLIPIINQVGTLTPVSVQNDNAEYYFQQTIAGQTVIFMVEFVKENGVWKIEEF